MKSTTAEDILDEAVSNEARTDFENAKKAVLDAYANFLEAKKHLKRAALSAGIDFKESATEHLDDALTRAKEKKDEVYESAGAYVKENPMTSTSIAFLGGVLFSRIFGK